MHDYQKELEGSLGVSCRGCGAVERVDTLGTYQFHTYVWRVENESHFASYLIRH